MAWMQILPFRGENSHAAAGQGVRPPGTAYRPDGIEAHSLFSLRGRSGIARSATLLIPRSACCLFQSLAVDFSQGEMQQNSPRGRRL